MKAAVPNSNWFYVVGSSGTVSANFVHRRSHAEDVGEYRAGSDLLAHDPLQNDCFKERETKRIGRKEETGPSVRLNEFEGRQRGHDASDLSIHRCCSKSGFWRPSEYHCLLSS